MLPLIEPLSAKNLVGEANTSGVPAVVAATTALSTTFIQASSIPLVPVLAYDVEPHVEVPSSSIIVFEKEKLETTPDHPETIGEANTSGVPAVVAATTALSTTFIQASSIPLVPVLAYDVEPHVEVPSSSIIVFEKEKLETTPDHPETS
nr:hypothetical protein [Tanacetum cinerariifolium]